MFCVIYKLNSGCSLFYYNHLLSFIPILKTQRITFCYIHLFLKRIGLHSFKRRLNIKIKNDKF